MPNYQRMTSAADMCRGCTKWTNTLNERKEGRKTKRREKFAEKNIPFAKESFQSSKNINWSFSMASGLFMKTNLPFLIFRKMKKCEEIWRKIERVREWAKKEKWFVQSQRMTELLKLTHGLTFDWNLNSPHNHMRRTKWMIDLLSWLTKPTTKFGTRKQSHCCHYH